MIHWRVEVIILKQKISTSVDDNISKDSFESCMSKELVKEESFPRYYLRRSSRASLDTYTWSNIEKYSVIQNVAGDGNCGIYSVMEGLCQVTIECTMDVNAFR